MAKTIDAAGLMIIHGSEGCAHRLPNGTFTAYVDPGSGHEPISIGWGSTGPDIHLGLIWTQAQCDARFTQMIAWLDGPLQAAIGTVPTSDNEFSAMGSLAYNIGMGNFHGSSVLRFHRLGLRHAAALAFPAWNKSKGQVMPGLTIRRINEAALYLTPDGGKE